MKHFSDNWIKEWCQDNGWTDLFLESRHYWAFPPHAVMPLPIPKETLIQIKAEKGLSQDEKIWSLIAVMVTIIAIAFTYLLHNPMALVFAFAFTAIIVANFELEY
ncbi:MAG: hypothetical protein GW795_05255 [Cyanobacteria bacterium]|nr:hypothetical protein [Cyanobacteria bacterium CG_2015-16_32_12]NCO79235.1 hypothetical protein [Cyanobacteria bacterium CG_2015-22_32_23]NCQ04483.1 hypothetical protein [Cyanobacteria bacterium CG_2015-09_32_10]NCQ41294.1 hypothetical protein [Cyanobacteria bacterium CG_2015-04_32_10]NCS84393.1 hypothetical protein [Cyanobacteria bacterium CG_2015-02_32_10]